MTQKKKAIKKPTSSEEKMLRFCSRCGKEWCPLGKITKYGKHYPAGKIKEKDGTIKEFPADDEIKEAVCSECAKDIFDSNSTPPSEIEELAKQLHEWYLEACQKTESGFDFNPKAQEPYEALREPQKFLDRYIAGKVLEHFSTLRN